MTVAAADAERAMAEACAALATGCREGAGGPGEVLLDFWVPARSADPEGLRALLAGSGLTARVEAAPEDDSWRDAMHAFHRPVEIAGRLLVRPPWEPPRPGAARRRDRPGHGLRHRPARDHPGLPDASGRAARRGALLDAGCGSGVLSIAARRLGFDPVWSADSDPLAVEATIANARRNGVGLRIGRRTIGADRLPACATVTANLTGDGAEAPRGRPAGAGAPAPDRLGHAPRRGRRGGGPFARHGLATAERIEDEGWATVLLERP